MTTTSETVICECGTSFQWDAGNDEFIRKHCRPSHCVECDERNEEERQSQLAEQRLIDEIEAVEDRAWALIPRRYQATNRDHPTFNLDLWERAKQWRPTDDVPFLGLIGDSGGSKTRIAFMLWMVIISERVHRRGVPGRERIFTPRFAALTSSAFSLLVGRQFLSNSGSTETISQRERSDARDELDLLRRCDVLLLDDLGKAKNTPSVAGELFAIIDHRHAHNLTTLWTANSVPEAIVSGMSEDLAGPLAGRLIECSTVYRV